MKTRKINFTVEIDDNDLVEHIIETLDGDSIELVGYNVNVTITQK